MSQENFYVNVHVKGVLELRLTHVINWFDFNVIQEIRRFMWTDFFVI